MQLRRRPISEGQPCSPHSNRKQGEFGGKDRKIKFTMLSSRNIFRDVARSPRWDAGRDPHATLIRPASSARKGGGGCTMILPACCVSGRCRCTLPCVSRNTRRISFCIVSLRDEIKRKNILHGVDFAESRAGNLWCL